LGVPYPILAAVFFASVLLLIGGFVLGLCVKLKVETATITWSRFKRPIKLFYVVWFLAYVVFILSSTGPRDLRLYPAATLSPYKLPWKAGVERFVSQGNRSFTSHRDAYEFSWDFWMKTGTEILAARDGEVLDVQQSFDGIGLNSNYIKIRHGDGTIALYAHIKHMGSLVKIGDPVHQGQPIALSGMVGQTVNPHLHFTVFEKKGISSIPVSFADVPNGVPFAGHFYKSENSKR
jgi:murein DD-endopeptidase MepM/ murein hydrolase activator NlpD